MRSIIGILGLYIVIGVANPAKADTHIRIDTTSSISSYADIIRARAEYIRAVGEAWLNEARAQYQLALARGMRERARQLEIYGKRLELDLWRLRRDEHKERGKIELITNQHRNLSLLNTGKTSPRTWAALNYFLIHIVPPDTVAAVVVVEVPEDAKSVDNFSANSVVSSDVDPFTGSHVGELLNFLEENNYSLKRFKPAHIQVLKLVAALGTPAEAKLNELQLYLEQLRKNTFNIWNPPWVGVFPTDGSTIRDVLPSGPPPAG